MKWGKNIARYCPFRQIVLWVWSDLFLKLDPSSEIIRMCIQDQNWVNGQRMGHFIARGVALF